MAPQSPPTKPMWGLNWEKSPANKGSIRINSSPCSARLAQASPPYWAEFFRRPHSKCNLRASERRLLWRSLNDRKNESDRARQRRPEFEAYLVDCSIRRSVVVSNIQGNQGSQRDRPIRTRQGGAANSAVRGDPDKAVPYPARRPDAEKSGAHTGAGAERDHQNQ